MARKIGRNDEVTVCITKVAVRRGFEIKTEGITGSLSTGYLLAHNFYITLARFLYYYC